MNLNEKEPNIELTRGETLEEDDIPLHLLRNEMRGIESETVSSNVKLESQTSNTVEPEVICNQSIQPKLNKCMKLSRRVKFFKCSICGYSSSIKCNFKIHLRSHNGEKPFKCNICDCNFGTKGVFKRHLRIHTGEKPFKCNICDKSFRCKSILKNHLKTDTGKKPLKCTICEYSTAHKSHFNAHLRDHKGEKPFKCNLCDYRFSVIPLM